jgi:signal transduction histidine kinase
MISGLVLLLVLQAFWLQSAYEKASADFRRETDFLFRNLVYAMHDSAIVRNMEAVEVDSGPHILNSRIHLPDIRVRNRQEDSTAVSSKIHIFFQSIGNLPQKEVVKMMASGIRNVQEEGEKGWHKGFVLRLGSDTLNIDSLSVRYKRALTQAGIEVPFIINHARKKPDKISDRLIGMVADEPSLSIEKTSTGEEEEYSGSDRSGDTIQSGLVGINQMSGYAVSFTHVRGLIVKEIMPQILFSVLLTMIIAAAFFLMLRSIRSQEKLMKLKNDFINNMTHELKTPVATVSVAIEALKNFRALDNPELTREYLDIAQNELNRLTLMTDKILNTSLFEKGTMAFSPEKVDPDLIVQQILTSMKLVFEKKKAVVTYEKKGTGFILEGSTIHLTNMIYNLIDNAIKYSPGEPVIRIQLISQAGKLILSVKDNGIGIQPEFQKKVFEKFFRVPTGDVHNIKGYGLGLSYVSAVVKEHGGSVTVDSVPGEGSCFTVTFPQKSGVRKAPLQESAAPQK